MNRISITTVVLLLAIGSLAFFSSCKKDNDDHKLTVIVTANDSVRVANAMVHVFVPVSNSYIKGWFDPTNERGEVDYAFPDKVIVEIEASKGSFKGCTFAEVNAGSNVVYVDVKPYCAKDNGCPPCQ